MCGRIVVEWMCMCYHWNCFSHRADRPCPKPVGWGPPYPPTFPVVVCEDPGNPDYCSYNFPRYASTFQEDEEDGIRHYAVDLRRMDDPHERSCIKCMDIKRGRDVGRDGRYRRRG